MLFCPCSDFPTHGHIPKKIRAFLTLYLVDLMDPAITRALLRCGAVNMSDAGDEDDYLRWIDGYNQHRPEDPAYQRPLAQIGGAGFRGCRRDQFLEELAKEVPQGVVEFRKRLDKVEENTDNGSVVLIFADGTSAEVNAGMSPPFTFIIDHSSDATDGLTLDGYTSHRLRWD